jgi:hypothetical protein
MVPHTAPHSQRRVVAKLAEDHANLLFLAPHNSALLAAVISFYYEREAGGNSQRTFYAERSTRLRYIAHGAIDGGASECNFPGFEDTPPCRIPLLIHSISIQWIREAPSACQRILRGDLASAQRRPVELETLAISQPI